MDAATPRPEIRQHTDDQGRVLLVKCVDKDGKSHNGFQWPTSGLVDPGKWSMEATCESGGLFGWAWGLNLGGGKEPAYGDVWIVFAAPADQIVDLGDKQKSGPAEVLYYGHWFGALQFTQAGREAYRNKLNLWIAENSRGAASATGERGAASATGERGAASATGWRGAASATGESGAASATGERGAASATGESGAASATGESGAASATGSSGAASATGESGAASATGSSGAASATWWRGAASATGESGAASATGWRGAASATGESGAASATGWSGAASATGERGAASATGSSGAAIVTGESSTIEIGPTCVGVAMAEVVFWRYRPGAILVQRWQDGDNHPHVVLSNLEGVEDGALLRVEHGAWEAVPDAAQWVRELRGAPEKENDA